MDIFNDRYEAGKVLAEYLKQYQNKPDVIVLALPRGGVPVAFEIAKSLNAPLDVFIVRKLGVPWHEELAMGAIASGGTVIFNDNIVQQLNITKPIINQVIDTEENELKRREIMYRGKRPFPNLKNKTIILVDDGIATGATMKVAIKGLREHSPAKIIVAAPVAALETYEEIEKLVDHIICPLVPTDFYAVAKWYVNFPQTSDEEVFDIMSKAKEIQ